MKPMPFLDLKAQQARIAADLRRAPGRACWRIASSSSAPRSRNWKRELAQFCGARHCVGVSSGTDAIQIALMAEDIGPRRRGVPAGLHLHRNRRGAAGARRHAGVRRCRSAHVPDRSRRIWRTRIADVRARGQTAAARADRRGSVRPAGGLAGAVRDRRARRTCSRSTTCAQSFGCTLHGSTLGAAADATATSFFPSKPLGAYGDGGALFTESDERADLYRSLRTHGEGTTRYEVLRTGMNGRLDSMQAAVLLAKLTVFPEELAARERIARYYDRASATLSLRRRACRTAPAPGRSTPSCCATGRARPRAGGIARGRRAHGDLLPPAAASPARLSRAP